ncbi:MAG: hypothetical protein KGJ58_02450 [Patescibacteria group bacterium]|nr:hypothetical protein [Patescibacteria group bacterium]MDE1988251.1 hypothetical protein [Patescibacteria group bacterium]MDE2218288.1 hypothetical protein [Patescibacteria group bacterium]
MTNNLYYDRLFLENLIWGNLRKIIIEGGLHMFETEGFYFLLVLLGMLVFYVDYSILMYQDCFPLKPIVKHLIIVFILIISISLGYFGLNGIEKVEKNWKKSHPDSESLNSGIPSPL